MPGGQASSDWMDVYTNFFEEPIGVIFLQPNQTVQNLTPIQF